MAEFTAGPWSVPHFADPLSTCQCKYVLSDHHFGSIATVNWSPDDALENGCNPPLEEAKANARLIASAPDLYALAKGYEAFEADLILNGDWMLNNTVRMTQAQHDWMIRLQTQRNAALAAAEGPAS